MSMNDTFNIEDRSNAGRFRNLAFSLFPAVPAGPEGAPAKHHVGLVSAAFRAVAVGVFLTVLLEAFYVMVTDGTTFYPVVDFFLSISVILTVALLFIHQGTRAEAELVESEEKLRDLFDNAGDIIQSVDPGGRFLYVNRTWHDVLGYGPEELDRMDLWDILRGDQTEKCRVLLGRVAAGEDPGPVETVFVAKDGRSVHVEGRVNSRFENGTFISTRGIFRDTTERNVMEAALRESEERFRQIAEHTDDLIAVCDLSGYFKYASPSHSKLGYRPEDMRGHFIWDYVHPDDAVKLMEMMEKLADGWQGERRRSSVLRFIDKDGGIRELESSMTLIKDDGGSPGQIIMISRDMTDRRRTERETERTKDRYLALVERSPEGIIVIQNERLSFVNAASEDILGFPPGELLGTGFIERVRPEDRARVTDRYRKRLAGEPVPDRYEIELLKKDGGTVPVEIFAAVIDFDGKPADLVFLRDVTERRAMEARIRRSEELFRSITMTARDAIIKIDHEGNVVVWNPAAEEMFGYTREEIIGRNLHEIIAPARYREEHFSAFREFTRTGKGSAMNQTLELTGLTKDGREITVELSLAPINEGDRWSAIAVVRDITERKILTDRIESIMKDLEAKNRELETYTYTVSHDLKAPLVTIQGFAELLDRKYGDSLDDKARHYLERITEGTDRLGKLVTDLLELSRAGRKMREFEPWDLGGILDTVLEGLAGPIKARGVEIRRPEDFPTVMCDDLKLGQALGNLIGNAVKYMGDQDKPVVEIDWEDIGDMYEVRVRDNGMGISEADQERIFHAFERGQTDQEGTGIGLSIVRKVIEAHGGTVRVESEPGNGSTFIFTLPKMPAEKDEEVRDT